MTPLSSGLFRRTITLAALVAVAGSPAQAASYLLETPGTGFTTGYPGSYNLGYQFTVGSAALSVSALGFYDVRLIGLAESHPVGLWDVSGNLLASVTIASGLHVLENGFAFQDLLTPVTLSAGTDYILGAFWSTNTDQVLANFSVGSAPTFSGDASLVGARNTTLGTPASASFGFPSSSGLFSEGYSWVGPNLKYTTAAVPDTSSWIVEATVIVFLMVSLFAVSPRLRQRPV